MGWDYVIAHRQSLLEFSIVNQLLSSWNCLWELHEFTASYLVMLSYLVIHASIALCCVLQCFWVTGLVLGPAWSTRTTPHHLQTNVLWRRLLQESQARLAEARRKRRTQAMAWLLMREFLCIVR